MELTEGSIISCQDISRTSHEGSLPELQTIQASPCSQLFPLDGRALGSVQPVQHAQHAQEGSENVTAEVIKPGIISVLNGPNLLVDESVLQFTPATVAQIAPQPAVLKVFYPAAPQHVQSAAVLDIKEEREDYECQWRNCHKKFKTMEEMVNHVTDSHVKVERDVEYRCHWEGCSRNGRGFNARYKVLIHLRTHTNEKPHKCDICRKSFSRLENLKIHKRTHTGEKPYSCPVEGCNKAYTNSSDRFKHMRTHQTDKPYTCKSPGCNKRYTDPSSLRKHIKTHGHFSHTNNNGTTISVPHTTPPKIAISRLPISTEPVKAVDSCTVTNGVLTVTPNHIIGMTNRASSTLPAQIISLSNAPVSLPNLSPNPLLSSAIIVTTGSGPTNTQNVNTDCPPSSAGNFEQPTKYENCDGSVLGESGKAQDRPLDLTTSPVQSEAPRDIVEDEVGWTIHLC